MKKNHHFTYFSRVAIMIFLDQFSKWIILKNDYPYVCNRGIAWGISLSPKIIFVVVFIWFLFLFLTKTQWFPLKKISVQSQTALLFIFSGALGNLWDRWQRGCVIDFIDIKIFHYPWFNLADSFIVGGVIYLGYRILSDKEKFLVL